MNRITILKYLDSLLGKCISAFIPDADISKNRYGPLGSFLFIRPGGIGDAVLLIPVLNVLREQFPTAKITVLAEYRNSAVFKLCADIDTVLQYDRPSGLLQAVRGDYDVAIDTEQWHRLSAVVVRMTCAPVMIGYATNERSRLFTHPIRYSHDDYETDSFFDLLEPLGIQAGFVTERFLVIPETSVVAVSTLLADLGTNPFVTIFPGASIPERRWGADRFRQVAVMLSIFGVRVVVVGGKEDHQQGETIVDGGLGLNLAGRTSLSETAAVIDRSALLVSGDSGVLHIAVGLGKPTVSLFGPGRAKKWAPRGDRHIVINKELPCSPCTSFGNTPPCNINAQCMQSITADEVANAVTMLLTSVGVMPSCCDKRKWIEIV